MAADARRALAEGLIDAVAFVGGALGGWALGRWLGFDFIGGGWDARAVVGLVFLLAGLGLGKFIALRLRMLLK